MARMIPETIRKEATAGEKRLFRTFREYLPADYLVYYEPDIGGRRPDFVVIGPDLGLVVLEVKDYTRNTLLELNPDRWTIRTRKHETRTVTPPLKQARENAFRINDRLKRDAELVRTEGKHALTLKFPYGYGAALTRWTREEMVEEGLYAVMEPKWVLTREDVDPDHEKFSAILLRKKLAGMFTVNFSPHSIDALDLQRIRYHLFPEVRVGGRVRKVPHQEHILLTLDDLETMDLHQERLAKQIGEGHRLIRGVAGSGKTLILAARACLLAKENPDWRILILCFNISLAQWIRQLIDRKINQPESLVDFVAAGNGQVQKQQRRHAVEVHHFHDWLKRLRLRERDIPPFLDEPARFPGRPRPYDAILIDEGQDFAPEWFALAARMLNPETGSLLIVEDRAQRVYKRTRSYRQDTGLDFRGRSRILTVNYRNTAPIVRFAWDFYQAHAAGKAGERPGEEGVEVVAPQFTARGGPEPLVKRFSHPEEEAGFVADRILRLRREEGVAFSQVLILYRSRWHRGRDVVTTLLAALQARGIPHVWVSENGRSKRAYQPEDGRVKVCTIHSSKGLDSEAVFLVDTGQMPFYKVEEKEREASLLYIAMTRSRRHLTLTWSSESQYTRWFGT